MANVAQRKKSIVSVSTTSLTIDTPVANNVLLNQAAAQASSLYQDCISLRSRLLRIHDFHSFFALASSADSRSSTDPVTQLWDLFSLGIPLCYIFNLLPPPSTPINVETDPAEFDVSNEKAKKRAIVLFAMQIRNIPGCEQFTVTDLWDRDSTDGLVKVIKTVTIIVDQLPEEMFEESPPSPQLQSPSVESLNQAPPLTSKEAARNHIIKEIVETERKYVQELEFMQKYSNALSQANVIPQDTIHLLFPNLNKLLNFQRKFLIRLEGTAELPWQDQRWGLQFIENENEFIVYEPYCANYTNASELMLANEANLMSVGLFASARELPAFLIKPIQRICKYPLLLDSLIKATVPAGYPHFEELKEGAVAAKRITDKINEAQRRAENDATVKSLEGRVTDWKGHHLSHFGDLLLDDIFAVTKSEVDREYHVFLFEKIILCCKEALTATPNGGRKVSKNGSILKKQSPSPFPMGGSGGPNRKKTTPLLLKGRIFLNNVTQAVAASPRNSTSSPLNVQHALQVWWRGDDDLEFFTLRCRTEEQLKQWENQINKMITKSATGRRPSERGNSIAKIALSQVSNSTNPAQGRQFSMSYTERAQSSYTSSSYLGAAPSQSVSGRRLSPYSSDDQAETPGIASSYGSGPQGYPPHDGFDFDDDEFEDYPPSSSYPSGRGTPVSGQRRNTNAVATPPPERDSMPGYERPRAQTEDMNGFIMAQWRNNGALMPPPPPPPASGIPPTPHRSTTPRSSQYAENPSQNQRQQQVQPQRPVLRSQFSSTRLKSGYENSDSGRNSVKSPSLSGMPPPSRLRSASQPTAYVPKTEPPPLPSTPWVNRTPSSKRESNSSQSTGGDSSEYSPNSSSPITPFGSSESCAVGVALRPSRSQNFENAANAAGQGMHLSPLVKVKVHFHEDIFVIQVPRSTDYSDLVEKVGKKIRLCGPRRDDGPLRVKYRDEDGDLVSMGSTDDVQMAFEAYRPGGQVTVFVT